MVIIKKEGLATVYIPTNGYKIDYDSGGFLPLVNLIARSTADETEVNLLPIGASYPTLFVGVMPLPSALFEGEWEYTFSAKVGGKDTVVSTGIMQVVGSDADVVEYDSEIQYKQYGE